MNLNEEKKIIFKCLDEANLDEKLNPCKRCGGEAQIYNDGGPGYKNKGDWIAACKQCDNEYHGCDYKPWTTKNWNRDNPAEEMNEANSDSSFRREGKRGILISFASSMADSYQADVKMLEDMKEENLEDYFNDNYDVIKITYPDVIDDYEKLGGEQLQVNKE